MKVKTHLVGFAIDLSGSMQSSIRNQTGSHINRFDSIKNSLDELFEKAKTEIEIQKQRDKDTETRIYFYSYGFGLKNSDYCDLLSLIRAKDTLKKAKSHGLNIVIGAFQEFDDPFEKLGEIANSHYKRGWGKRCRIVFQESEANILANILIQNPQMARELCYKLPDNMLNAGYDIGQSWVMGSESNLKQIEREAKESISMIEKGLSEFHKTIKKYTTMRIEDVADELFRENKSSFDEMSSIIYGDTPMVSTLEEIRQRIKYEESSKGIFDKKLLFIISDGEPTDGNPDDIFYKIRSDGVTVISCLITNEDIAKPKTLFATPNQNWNEGANLMFKNASMFLNNSDFEGYLLSRGWEVPPSARLFVQVNHSEVLKEFTDLVLTLIKKENGK